MTKRTPNQKAVLASVISGFLLFAAFAVSSKSRQDKGAVQIVTYVSHHDGKLCAFVLTNSSPSNASVMFWRETFVNGKWIPEDFSRLWRANDISPQNVTSFDVDRPNAAEPWRVHFITVERNPGPARYFSRIGLFFKHEGDLAERWDNLIHGEVTREFDLVSDTITRTALGGWYRASLTRTN